MSSPLTTQAWLYPKRLVAWLTARWPHQANTSLLNLGIPGTGPTMFALCLQSLLAAPPGARALR